ncbi:glycoside hydrolase family 5 protein [Athelia psychrophila]|uniref:Glycoside hydrolase family 5 protein n=1 Tax=Athelia psychrophila TaxID=1759441 RepID=A0A165ZSL2_9AGAM|nr:glycoside hydrolase family 5 protein [Fibularhizoctonia sp. CBS 109695]
MYLFLFALSLLLPAVFSSAVGPLHTTDRWIVDSSQNRVKLRCTNWGGHLETNIPEGLQHQPVDSISSWIAENGFNCVRLTYSIDMALGPNVLVSDSFNQASAKTGAPNSSYEALYTSAVQQNPFISSATLLSTYSAVISSLATHNIAVILDNHVSKAIWCCNLTDGNGWFDDTTPYVASNQQYFNTANWLAGLSAMATYALGYPNVVGMSLRNEMRPLPIIQDIGNTDWYSHVTEGAQTIHSAAPDLLIMIGGINGATDSAFLRDSPLDTSGWANRTVWEYHIYSYSVGYTTSDCSLFQTEMGAAAGFLLESNKAFTGPLWLSEFGVGMTGGNNTGLDDQDSAYLTCLVDYMESNDADWSVWALQGDYYVREGQTSSDESYGLLNGNWDAWRNPEFPGLLGKMWNVTQGP